MDYSPEQFFRLAEEIQDQGGEQLDEMCSAREYSFTGPNPEQKSVLLPGCGNMSLFEFPYENPIPHTENASVLQPVKLCAVCDDLGAMPRFAGAIDA